MIEIPIDTSNVDSISSSFYEIYLWLKMTFQSMTIFDYPF